MQEDPKAKELKEALLRKLQDGAGQSGPKKDDAQKGRPAEERILSVLKQIHEMRSIQKAIAQKNKDNEALLGTAKDIIDDYKAKAKSLEEERKALSSHQARYDEVIAELKETRKMMQSMPSQSGNTAPLSADKAKALELEKYRLEEQVSELEDMLKREKGIAANMKYFYERQILEASTRSISDPEIQRSMHVLKQEIKERDSVIQTLLAKRKIIPEEERLMITWLNATLEEERRKNAGLKEKAPEADKDKERGGGK